MAESLIGNSPPKTSTLTTFATECEAFARQYRGRHFFKALATFIADRTGVTYVLAGYPINGNENRIRTAVLLAGGKFIEKYEYDLHGTPCENVMGRNCCYYPSGIQQMFPEDKELVTLGIHSYLGLPAFDQNNNAVGMLVIMDSKIIGNAGLLEEGLQKLTPRLALELKKVKKKQDATRRLS